MATAAVDGVLARARCEDVDQVGKAYAYIPRGLRRRPRAFLVVVDTGDLLIEHAAEACSNSMVSDSTKFTKMA